MIRLKDSDTSSLCIAKGKTINVDQLYNIMSSKEDYINPTTDGNLSWRSISSCTTELGDALENWQNILHEVSMRRCVRVIRVVQRVGSKECVLPRYEGLLNLASFLVEFEEKVTESQRLSTLDYILKDTPARWWVHTNNLYPNGHSVEY